MKIVLERDPDAVHFQARNESGDSIEIGTSEKNGGRGRGVGPMQALLMALAGCSAIDVLTILRKARQQVDTFRMEVDGDREQGKHPSPYQTIHVHYLVEGPCDADKVARAIQLSMEKYCSVSANLKPTSTITYSFELNGQQYD